MPSHSAQVVETALVSDANASDWIAGPSMKDKVEAVKVTRVGLIKLKGSTLPVFLITQPGKVTDEPSDYSLSECTEDSERTCFLKKG